MDVQNVHVILLVCKWKIWMLEEVSALIDPLCLPLEHITGLSIRADTP